jgi:hypothetical protein
LPRLDVSAGIRVALALSLVLLVLILGRHHDHSLRARTGRLIRITDTGSVDQPEERTMDGYGGENPVAALRAGLQAVEARLGRGDIPREGLEDVKSAVDDMRLRLWAVLSAASSGDIEGSLVRFRLRRAVEICRTAIRDLEQDPLGAHQKELRELRQVAGEVAARTDGWLKGG